MSKIRITTKASSEELSNRKKLSDLYHKNPLPEDELVSHSALFLKRQELSKILFFNEIYQKVLSLHGVIMEFGCRWGQNLVTFNNLRGIHEPFNHNRSILGFDTFEGFKNIDGKDGKDQIMEEGAFSVSQDYQIYLESLLKSHENECPLNHISKNMVIKGDAPIELQNYLEENPQTIIAFAWFDMDIYRPTLECLKLIKPFLSKGAIIGFDELNDSSFPGETLAIKEFVSLNSIKLQRNKYGGMQSYFIFE